LFQYPNEAISFYTRVSVADYNAVNRTFAEKTLYLKRYYWHTFTIMKRIQTRKTLGQLYGVDKETITRWLKRMGINHRYALLPMELELFKNKVGTPEQLKQLSKDFGLS